MSTKFPYDHHQTLMTQLFQIGFAGCRLCWQWIIEKINQNLKKKNTETVNEYSDNMPFLTFDPKQNTFSFFLTINIAFKQVSFESIKDR